MALPAVEVSKFRSQVTSLTDSLRSIDEILMLIEDFGADDAARVAFISGAFGEATDNPDLTIAQFTAGIVALRAMRTAWATEKLAIVQLRR